MECKRTQYIKKVKKNHWCIYRMMKLSIIYICTLILKNIYIRKICCNYYVRNIFIQYFLNKNTIQQSSNLLQHHFPTRDIRRAMHPIYCGMWVIYNNSNNSTWYYIKTYLFPIFLILILI